ncbi:hypothetical protein ABIE58_002914 [Roseovarius sp. MBR-78]|jgi:hypothetical protein
MAEIVLSKAAGLAAAPKTYIISDGYDTSAAFS